jgi:hypothetical protein
MQPKPTYILIELRTAGPDGENDFIREAFEAQDDAAAIANAKARWGTVPFDLVRCDASGERAVSVQSHRPTSSPPADGQASMPG